MVTRPGRAPAAAVVAASLALVGFMTLRPAEAPSGLPTFCIFCGALGGVDFTLNTVLFVPLGLGLRWLLGRWTTSTMIGVVTTLVIEMLQWRFIPGRDASLGDLVANTLGAMVGAWLAVAALHWLNATSSAARRFAGSFGVTVTLIVSVLAWLLQPTQTTYPQWVQWKPERKNLDTFLGSLTEVDLNGTPIRPTEVLPGQRAFDRVARRVTVRATLASTAGPTRRQAIIVRIANPLEEGFYLAQWGDAVVFRTHMVAADLRLRPLLVGLEGALPPSSIGGDTSAALIINALSNSRAMVVSREWLGSETSVTLRRTVGLAWALFLPWDIALGPAWWLASATWLGVLVLPVAFFTVRSGGTGGDRAARGVAWWPLLLVLATMIAVPAAAGLSALGAGEWLGVLAGLGAGFALERLTAPVSADLKASAHLGTILS